MELGSTIYVSSCHNGIKWREGWKKGVGKETFFIMYPLPIIAWLEGGVRGGKDFYLMEEKLCVAFSFLFGGGGVVQGFTILVCAVVWTENTFLSSSIL